MLSCACATETVSRRGRLEHFPCAEPQCVSSFVAFGGAAALAAHRRDAHSAHMPRFDRARARPLQLGLSEPTLLPRGPASTTAATPASASTGVAGTGGGLASGSAAGATGAVGRTNGAQRAPAASTGGADGNGGAGGGGAGRGSERGEHSRQATHQEAGSAGSGGGRGSSGNGRGGSGEGRGAAGRGLQGGGGLVMIDDDLGLQDSEVHCLGGWLSYKTMHQTLKFRPACWSLPCATPSFALSAAATFSGSYSAQPLHPKSGWTLMRMWARAGIPHHAAAQPSSRTLVAAGACAAEQRLPQPAGGSGA